MSGDLRGWRRPSWGKSEIVQGIEIRDAYSKESIMMRLTVGRRRKEREERRRDGDQDGDILTRAARRSGN
jgi:hypothetical protein